MAESTQKLRGLLVSQFFGAFNDNAWKLVVTFLAIRFLQLSYGVDPAGFQAKSQSQATLTFCVLTLPLILFSIPAGVLADRISKRRVIIGLKLAEVILMGSAALVLWLDPERLLMPLVILGLMGAQSALFSPAKYGILPELLGHEQLSHGNARLEMWTFLAIILGTGTGGLLLDLSAHRLWIPGALLFCFSLIGFSAAFAVPKVPAARTEGNFLGTLRQAWDGIRGRRILKLAVVGSVFYWTIASLLGQDILVYAKTSLGLSDTLSGVPLAVFGLGVGAGSLLAGRLSRSKVEYGLIPLGAVLMTAAGFTLAALSPEFQVLLMLMVIIGVASGLIVVPLNALIQWHAPADRRGGVIALANVFVFGGILLGSLSAGFFAELGFSPGGLFLVSSVALAAGTLWSLWLLPDALLRVFLLLLTLTFYRIRVIGAERVPTRGRVLLAPNHVSLVDALVLISSLDRPIRFLVDEAYFGNRLLNPFMKLLQAIPVSAAAGPRSLLRALRTAAECLEQDEVVGIFPEGEMTRTGGLLPFRRGIERLAKRSNAVIVPVYLDGLWGSVFSYRGGRVLFKRPRRILHQTTVSFGEPLPPETPAEEVRQTVQKLGAESWARRREDTRPLHASFLRRARWHPFSLLFAEVDRQLRSLQALAGAVALARLLSPFWTGQQRVGILLPSSIAGALANIAASLSGRESVNLNFTAGEKALTSAARQAELKTVLTSRRFLQQSGVQVPDSLQILYLEDFLPELTVGFKIWCGVLGFLLPLKKLERWCGSDHAATVAETVTVIFSSGSTGDPKGVMLSHFNVASNVEGISQVLGVNANDRALGILPFFHSFGFVLFWFSATQGVPLVLHPSPVDARQIGNLVHRFRVTLMLAPPTFLQLYTRRCAPGQFGSLRLVIAGAEKLTAQVAQAFEQRFGLMPLEGYGCTECAPVVTVSTPAFRSPGYFQPGSRRGFVGRPLPGIAVQIVDPETFEPRPPGEDGLLLIKGPNVMQGYLNRPDLTRQAVKDDWYVTGDLAAVNEDGFLRISDRISRFSKIGGEMVPHGRVEEALHHALGGDWPAFAVTGLDDNRKGESLVVLHTCPAERIPEILKMLKEMGLPNLFIPRADRFIAVDRIPLLGTGKVALSEVKRIASERLSERQHRG